jgi:outer membrane protein insertion porin family
VRLLLLLPLLLGGPGSARAVAGADSAAVLPAADSAAVAPAADSAAVAPAEAPVGPATLIGQISVIGNAVTETDRIVRSFGVLAGTRYSTDAVRRGIVKLVALGLFSDVWVEKHEHDEVVDLVIHVQERPRISKIEFSGNRRKETSELEKKLSLHAGEICSPGAMETQVDSLLKFYREEGYSRAQVHAALDSTAGAHQVVLRFAIDEGERLQITKVVFEGATPELEAKLRKQLKTKPRGFFGGGQIKDESFDDDRQKLEAWYRSEGYRDMRVVSHEVRPGDTPRHVTLVFTIEQGRRYSMGRVGWKGNTIIPTPELAGGLRVRAGDRYDASKIEHAQGLAYAAYSEQGYLSVSIEPKETVRDSVVDVTFNVTEGPSSNIRYITISGNKNTREKVLRRELSIHEGDRFRRSSLMRTRDDLMRLGIFEDIQPDLGPADSSDVDIILKVKEKQVGTASAGAGYTGETGLTGFIELGHNNVLGNAQTLSLHLERGARRSDYYLSFTEPWFRDTPTLLGFSVYNSAVDRDFYREARRGGSVKLGRPLAWPDYSRGTITYRLENVGIDSLPGIPTGITDPAVLATITSGQTQRTSTVMLDFARNSSNHPMYPTRGTRLLINSQFAGGPFGGNIQFQKQRLEGRVYMPTVFRNVTTMARARFGVLGAFPNQGMVPPAYETFRLGGGTTLDPLRGYEDYQVVPEKFIHTVATVTRRDFDPNAAPDSTIIVFTKQRYPGGRFFETYTVEEQFPVVNPLHAVLFVDAGNTWDQFHEIQPLDLKVGAGIGFRLEIPLLGNVGFDFGYGFNRDDGPRFKGHFLLGNVNF